MVETTTIQVRKDQAKKLKEIQGPSGNYKTAIDTVLEGHMKWRDVRDSEDDTNDIDESEIARMVTNDLKAELPGILREELR